MGVHIRRLISLGVLGLFYYAADPFVKYIESTLLGNTDKWIVITVKIVLYIIALLIGFVYLALALSQYDSWKDVKNALSEAYRYHFWKMMVDIGKATWMVPIFIIVFIIALNHDNLIARIPKHNTTKNRTTGQLSRHTNKYPSVVLPQNGISKLYSYNSRVAPLEFNTAGNSHFYIKLVDHTTGKTVMTVFVRSGSRVDVDVPLGDYIIKYASGDSWYGEEHLFGDETSYIAADDVFNFYQTDEGVSGYTITLYQVPGGNLQTNEIEASDF